MKREKVITASPLPPPIEGEKERAMHNCSAVFFADDFSQRIKKYDVKNGLQPHSMWLKPVFDCNYSVRQLKQTAIQIHNQIHNYCEGKELIMKEMNYNGSNTGLNLNPEGLHVYRKTQHRSNTTPAGVAQPMFIVHFYKHSMPPASLLPLTEVNGKETASRSTGLQPNNMWLKPVSAFNISNRQLKQTAINSAAHSAPKNEISTVYINNTPALGGTTGADELGLVGSVFNN